MGPPNPPPAPEYTSPQDSAKPMGLNPNIQESTIQDPAPANAPAPRRSNRVKKQTARLSYQVRGTPDNG